MNRRGSHKTSSNNRATLHKRESPHFEIARVRAVMHRGIIADNLKAARWSLGWVSALDLERRTIWIVDAHGYGKRFIVQADEKLTAFMELESAISGLPRIVLTG